MMFFVKKDILILIKLGIIECGKNFGLKPRLHVDEFEDIGGIELAIEAEQYLLTNLWRVIVVALIYYQKAMLLLHCCVNFLFLNLDNYAPAREIIDKGVSVALATDYNWQFSHEEHVIHYFTFTRN